MSVRLYGRDVGNGSLAVVTRGFREALQAAELLEGLVALDRSGGSEEDEAPLGALARDGIFTGNLNMLPAMTRGARHERHWVQVTPNSTFVPKELLGAVLKLRCPRILSCSTWGTQIILTALAAMGAESIKGDGLARARAVFAPRGNSGEVRLEVLTVRHGISGFAPFPSAIEDARRHYDDGQFRVVHFSTTEGERKGTLELVKAWQAVRAELPEKAQLYLVLDYHARAALLQRLLHEERELPQGVSITPRADLDAEKMSRFLCHMHLVACPSRGEGFGLLPLQARACGVPVIATVTTGHSAGHVEGPGVVPIVQPPWLEPIDDGPAALACPLVYLDIASALHQAYRDWKRLSEASVPVALEVAREWTWQKQLEPLIAELR